MKAVVLGRQSVDYFSEKKQKQVTGTSIFVAYKDTGVEGMRATDIWVASDSPVVIPKFEYGKEYDFVYDGFGRYPKLVEIRAVD